MKKACSSRVREVGNRCESKQAKEHLGTDSLEPQATYVQQGVCAIEVGHYIQSTSLVACYTFFLV